MHFHKSITDNYWSLLRFVKRFACEKELCKTDVWKFRAWVGANWLVV